FRQEGASGRSPRFVWFNIFRNIEESYVKEEADASLEGSPQKSSPHQKLPSQSDSCAHTAIKSRPWSWFATGSIFHPPPLNNNTAGSVLIASLLRLAESYNLLIFYLSTIL